MARPKAVSTTAALADELRDLSTRQPSGASTSRWDGPPRNANDGDTRQIHPYEYHADGERLEAEAAAAGGHGAPSYWWVKLRRLAANPEVKLWTRSCCNELFGNH